MVAGFLSPHALVAASTSSAVLTELGAVIVALAVVGRLAARFGLPSIPLYLIAGLLVGEGSVIPLAASAEFIRVGADVGVVLLLLFLGLEYTPAELRSGLATSWRAGAVDLAANAAPGLLAGLLLGWDPVAAVVLAGVAYISSSGIIAKQLFDLDRIANRETSTVLTILVLEDLAMAAYLPLVGVLLGGAGPTEAAASVGVALAAIAAMLVVVTRWQDAFNRMLETSSSELLLLSILGVALVMGGLAERVQVSAAVAAFFVGVALSGRVAERSRELLQPVRDVFGGLFFVFFGLQIDPGALRPVLAPAAALALIGVATKTGTGWWAARRVGIGPRGRLRAGLSLVPRGEFSIVIASLAAAANVEPELGPLAAAYVLILAVVGSLLMRFADHVPLAAARRAARPR
ncbi:MAG: cation:proton antiporter [Acidimicrobiales bacterium]